MRPIVTTINYWLVGISLLTSIVASYAALSFADRLSRSKRLAYCFWLFSGSAALGLGIWSMHYLGMLAVSLPVDVVYHIPTVLLSLVCAVLASVSVLVVVSREQLTTNQICLGSVLMGSGIGAMHNIGMHAMRSSAMHRYRPWLVAVSVAVAVGFSWLAIWISFVVRTQTIRREWLQMSAATVMGSGIAAMHYIAMAAVTFVPGVMSYSRTSTLHISSIGMTAVAGTTAIVLFGALITTLLDRQVYEQLEEERDHFHAAAESSMDSLYICSAVRDGAGAIVDFVFAYLNSNVQKMVSLSCEQMLGKRMCELLPVNRSLGLFDLYCKVVESGEPLVHEFAVTDNDVISTWIRIQAVKVRDGIAITASDITARKRDEASILHLAHHDPLTGLINRSLLLERIEQAIENAKRYGSKFGLLLIDLDGFKQVNDTLGHAAGDAVLVMTAQRLHAAVRAIDSVIRMGGDEFLVVLRDIDEMRHLTLCASKILGVVQDPYPLNNQWVRITCSVGAAMYTGAALTCEDLIGHADAAMYTAKRRGKNQVEVYAHAEVPERVSFSARPTSISGEVH